MNQEVLVELKKLMEIFPDSFINRNMELILIPKTNTYFITEDCANKRDVIAKLLMWCTRDISKGIPFKNEIKNRCFRGNNLIYLNSYLGTEFYEDDLALIYQKLGNGIRRELTYKFIDSGFDIKVLQEISK